MSHKYRCSGCEEETIHTEEYSDSTASIADYCETCGHLNDFVDVEGDYWNDETGVSEM